MILNKIVDLHTLHIYVHPCNQMLIFLSICTYICILQLFIIFWVTYILCDYSFITSFLSISCLCNCVCSYVYICVYIYVSPTHTAHVHTSMYTCAQFLTHPQAFINTHSFISMLIVHCLCVMLSFNMYTPVPVSVLICYDCECACAEYFFTVYISLNVQCWAKLHNLLTALNAVKKPSMQLITLFSCQL